MHLTVTKQKSVVMWRSRWECGAGMLGWRESKEHRETQGKMRVFIIFILVRLSWVYIHVSKLRIPYMLNMCSLGYAHCASIKPL